jgi:hypothetical protein
MKKLLSQFYKILRALVFFKEEVKPNPSKGEPYYPRTLKQNILNGVYFYLKNFLLSGVIDMAK